MNRLWTTVTIIILLLVFIGYMVFDLALRKGNNVVSEQIVKDTVPTDQWIVERVFNPGKDKLKSLAVSKDGNIILGGDSFLVCYNSVYEKQWEINTDLPVTSIACSGNKIYAGLVNKITVYDLKGKKITEWGPFDNKTIITSVSANENYVAFADAGGKSVYILDKEGEVKKIIGKSGDPFIIPSPYFDVVLGSDNILYVANTGMRSIERRKTDGTIIDFFGEAGLAPDAFCGCCNPAHFALLPDGYVTAEKGVNRIKILNTKGEFVEFVSSQNKFLPPMPLDIATSADGRIIYGANPADSKLYIFKRKQL
jgi:hypothetical protein